MFLILILICIISGGIMGIIGAIRTIDKGIHLLVVGFSILILAPVLFIPVGLFAYFAETHTFDTLVSYEVYPVDSSKIDIIKKVTNNENIITIKVDDNTKEELVILNYSQKQYLTNEMSRFWMCGLENQFFKEIKYSKYYLYSNK